MFFIVLSITRRDPELRKLPEGRSSFPQKSHDLINGQGKGDQKTSGQGGGQDARDEDLHRSGPSARKTKIAPGSPTIVFVFRGGAWGLASPSKGRNLRVKSRVIRPFCSSSGTPFRLSAQLQVGHGRIQGSPQFGKVVNVQRDPFPHRVSLVAFNGIGLQPNPDVGVLLALVALQPDLNQLRGILGKGRYFFSHHASPFKFLPGLRDAALRSPFSTIPVGGVALWPSPGLATWPAWDLLGPFLRPLWGIPRPPGACFHGLFRSWPEITLDKKMGIDPCFLAIKGI